MSANKKKEGVYEMGIMDIFKKKKQQGTHETVYLTDKRIQTDDERIVSLPTKAKGADGADIVSGLFNTEYLGKLRGRDGIIELDKMRRSDDGVIRVLRMYINPIKSATWYIESGEAGNKQADEIAEAIQFDLFDDTVKSFSQMLNDILTFIPFGFSMFEPTFKVSESARFGMRWNLKDLGYRAQKTIYEWKIQDGAVVSVHQQFFGNTNVDVWLDGKNLIIFTHDREGDNFEGISLLRAIYGNYLRKQTYLNIMYSGLKKNASGIPVITTPAGRENTKEVDTAESFLVSYTDGEKPYLIVPEGFAFEIKEGKFDADKVQQIIEAENTGMVKSALVQFLELGQSGAGGSFALGTDQSDMFLDTLVGYGNYICEMINKYIIRPLVIMNHGEQAYYPTLKVAGIKDKASRELAEIIQVLNTAGILKPDETLVAWARGFYGLPEVDESTRIQAPTPSVPAPIPPVPVDDKGKADTGKADAPKATTAPTDKDKADSDDKIPSKGKQMGEIIRELTEYEQKVNIGEVEATFEQFSAQYDAVVRNRLNLMVEKYMADMANALKYGDDPTKLNVGMVREYAEAVGALIEKMEAEGFKQVEREIGVLRGGK
jgi:phage gp29-like protein